MTLQRFFLLAPGKQLHVPKLAPAWGSGSHLSITLGVHVLYQRHLSCLWDLQGAAALRWWGHVLGLVNWSSSHPILPYVVVSSHEPRLSIV